LYYYEASLVRVIDGDTFEADVDLGFNISQRIVFRLAGCDTPEVRGEERDKGILVSSIVRKWFDRHGGNFCVDVREYDKWGRSVAHVAPRGPTYIHASTLSFFLLKNRLAWRTDSDGRLTEERDLDMLVSEGFMKEMLGEMDDE